MEKIIFVYMRPLGSHNQGLFTLLLVKVRHSGVGLRKGPMYTKIFTIAVATSRSEKY